MSDPSPETRHHPATPRRRRYRSARGPLVVHPSQFVALSPEDEQRALAALAELLAPLFRPRPGDQDDEGTA